MMGLFYAELLKEFNYNSGASSTIIDLVMKEIGLLLPTDYCDFLCLYNGGEGFVGENYLIVWAVEELVQFNKEYQVDQYAPGLLLFGSDGGGEAFAFDYRNNTPTIVIVPFIGMELIYAIPVAETFTKFLSILASKHNESF